MHKARYNALVLKLQIRPRSPLLIKAGGISANPTLPDMPFVRTFHAQKGETLYIPGSSLKGVVRGFVEKVLRTLDTSGRPGPDEAKQWRWACATFEARDEERHDRNKWNCPQFLDEVLTKIRNQEERDLYSWEIYRYSCGACRLFGHTRLKGRVSFTDFLPVDEVRTEIRYGVAISRLSHAVAHGPFEAEIAVAGTFEGRLVLENFELWQAGLLALALESMNQGLVQVGFGKNRGFGEVDVRVAEAVLDEAANGAHPTVWRGLGAFVSEEEQRKYGLAAPHRVNGMPEGRVEPLGLYFRRVYTDAQWPQIARPLIQQITASA
ncbi:MAG TPA: RAMP superfamily CRISPR-associated protein [Thermoflexus sp.]|nr:RAMP superfamily CRISPR-associated protein [Thermoflexus sp.]